MPEAWIPDTYFVVENEEHLAFIGPSGTDTAAKNRLETALNWARPYGHYNQPKAEQYEPAPYSLDNVAVGGFKLKENISRYTTSNVVWRIVDPRGFEVELYSGNLNAILHEAGIVNGEFQGEYIYGREGANNILIPIGSELHDKVIEQTAVRKAPRLPVKDIEVGDLVELMSCGKRLTLTYAGYYHELCTYPRHDLHDSGRGSWDWQKRRVVQKTYQYSDAITKKKKHMFFTNLELEIHESKEPEFRPWSAGITEIAKPNIIRIVKKAYDKELGVDITEVLHDMYAAVEATKNWHYDDWTTRFEHHIFRVSTNRRELTAIAAKRIADGITIER